MRLGEGRVGPCCWASGGLALEGGQLLFAMVCEVLDGREGNGPGGTTVAGEKSPSEEGEDEYNDRAGDDGYDEDGGGGQLAPRVGTPADDVQDIGHSLAG